MIVNDVLDGGELAHLLVAIGLDQRIAEQIIGLDVAALEVALHGIEGQSHGGLDGIAVAEAFHLCIEFSGHDQGRLDGMVRQ
jgi:hypothetical protein